MRKQTFFLFSILLHLLLFFFILHMEFNPSITRLLHPPPPMAVKLVSPSIAAPLIAPSPARIEVKPESTPAPSPSSPAAQSGKPGNIPIIIRPFTLGGKEASGESVDPGPLGAMTGPVDEAPEADRDQPSRPAQPHSPPDFTRDNLFALGETLTKSLSDPDRLMAPSNPGGKGRFSSASFGIPGSTLWERGLSRGLGPGDGKVATGGGAVFNSFGYDITPWARRVVYRIKKNWLIPATARMGIPGKVTIYAVITKEGTIDQLVLRYPSRVEEYDKSALYAIKNSAPFPLLPDDFPYPSVEGLIIFHYN